MNRDKIELDLQTAVIVVLVVLVVYLFWPVAQAVSQ